MRTTFQGVFEGSVYIQALTLVFLVPLMSASFFKSVFFKFLVSSLEVSQSAGLGLISFVFSFLGKRSGGGGRERGAAATAMGTSLLVSTGIFLIS